MDARRFEVEVFEPHHARVWRFLARGAGRAAADELAGEVFVRAWAGRSRYDPDRGAVDSWLYGIAANLLRDRWRREARAAVALARHATVVDAAVSVPATEEVEDRVDGDRRLAAVRAAVASLPEPDREVLLLAAWEGLGYEAIAAALDVPVGTVRSRLSRARGRLRELLAASGEVTVDG